MRRSLKLTLLLAAVLIGKGVAAQSFSAQYTYDANGNRIKATIIYMTRSAAPRVTTDSLKVNQNSTLTVNLYPNPTKGELRIDLTGGQESQFDAKGNAIRIWDMQGKLRFSQEHLGASNLVDLSHYNDGIYIVQLFVGGNTKNYKIIKN